jgi:DNA-binding MarR family transcriptional regulator/DNA-binding IscR family transcriptional regulator
VEEGSTATSGASTNRDVLLNVSYANSTDGKSRNEQDEKVDEINDRIITDEKSKQVLIQKEQSERGSNGSKNHSFEDSFSTIDDVLRNNDTKILKLLDQEPGSSYSFNGFIRKLNLHQQSLTRALKRLEDLRLIEKSQIGYRLTTNGGSLMTFLTTKNGIKNYARSRSHAPDIEREKRNCYIQLLQTRISVDVRPEEILSKLIGKWFNNLRWVGLVESEDGGYMLQWVSDDNNSFQIILRVISKYLTVETNASSDKEKIEAMIGSYRIFEEITKILRNKLENTSIMPLLDINGGYISDQNN